MLRQVLLRDFELNESLAIALCQHELVGPIPHSECSEGGGMLWDVERSHGDVIHADGALHHLIQHDGNGQRKCHVHFSSFAEKN